MIFVIFLAENRIEYRTRNVEIYKFDIRCSLINIRYSFFIPFVLPGDIKNRGRFTAPYTGILKASPTDTLSIIAGVLNSARPTITNIQKYF